MVSPCIHGVFARVKAKYGSRCGSLAGGFGPSRRLHWVILFHIIRRGFKKFRRSKLVSAITRVLNGIGAAIRARWKTFLVVAAGVFALDLSLPPLVLSWSRKPWDYFAFNPWLKKLPGFLLSSEATLQRKLEFLPNLALFWFSADGPYGAEWGFAVTVADLGRFVLMSLLFGAYFALWFYRRDRLIPTRWGVRTARQGGVAGALASTLGLSTGPCTVTGCGAPVIPVLGLAFTGLSSGTLVLLAELSKVSTAIVLVAITLGVAYLGWTVGSAHPRSTSTPISDARAKS